MNMNEALAYISATSWQGSRLGLERMQEVMELLGNPQDKVKFIHIAGTNGKGSTSSMLSAILSAAGYTVGLYTSPHLCRYNERIQICGQEISDEEFCEAAEAVRSCTDRMEDPPTEFERITAMALWHFAHVGCDIVVLEVGLGGRLDATNVIGAPELAVITHLALEHTEILGDTLEQIAAEKGGIIKAGCDVVFYQQAPNAAAVIQNICTQYNCPLHITDFRCQTLHDSSLQGQVFSYRNRSHLQLRLLGDYQLKNAALALESIDALRARGWNIPESAVTDGLASASWPGRFEVLQQEPLVLVDGAHNPDGATELARCLAHFLPDTPVTFVMGVMADKDYLAILDIVAPFAKQFIAVTPVTPRALPSHTLKETIEARLHIPALDGGSVADGVRLALEQASSEDVLCIFGSLYQIGDVYPLFR